MRAPHTTVAAAASRATGLAGGTLYLISSFHSFNSSIFVPIKDTFITDTPPLSITSTFVYGFPHLIFRTYRTLHLLVDILPFPRTHSVHTLVFTHHHTRLCCYTYSEESKIELLYDVGARFGFAAEVSEVSACKRCEGFPARARIRGEARLAHLFLSASSHSPATHYNNLS